MSTPSYLDKLEEIKKRAYGTTKDEETHSTSQSALERIKAKAAGTYDGGIDLATVKSWFTNSESTIKGLSDYYKVNEGKWVNNYGSEFTDGIAKLKSDAEAVGYYLRSHKNDFSDYDSLSKAYSDYLSVLEEAEKRNASMRDLYASFTTEDEYSKWYENYKAKQDVLNSEDFEEYSQIGANIKNPTYAEADGGFAIGNWRPFGKADEIGNIVTFSRDNIEDIKKSIALSNNNADIANTLGDYRYQFMDDNEVAIYNYYLGKGDKEKADEFLKSLDDTLNQRHAGQIVENIDDTFLEPLFSVAAGFDSALTGTRDIVSMIQGTEGGPTTTTRYAQSQMQANNEGVFKVVNDLAYTTGNMLPSILVGSLTGGVGGALTLGTSAMGNAYTEMIKQGYNKSQARNYAVLVGASESVLQYALGGISKLGGKISGNVIANLVSKVDNAIARTAIQFIGNITSEAAEEAIQSVLEPCFKYLATGETFEGIEWEEVWYSAMLGALSAGFLEGVPTIAGTAVESHQAKDLYGADAQTLVNEALQVDPNNAFAQRKKAQLDGGKELSGYQLNRLAKETSDAMYGKDVTKMKAAAEARLTELGETGNVSALADVIVKKALGETLNPVEYARFKNSKSGLRVSNEISPENIQSGMYSSAWAERIGTSFVNAQEYNKRLDESAASKVFYAQKKTPIAVTEPPEEDKGAKQKLQVSEDGNTINLATNEEVTVKEIASVENGTVSLRLEDGSTVKAEDLSFSTAEEAQMYEMVARMDATPQVANEILATFKPTDSQTANMFATDVPLAYMYGKIGYEAGLNNIKLTDQQKRLAYNYGRMDAVAKVKASEKEKTASVGTNNSKKDSQNTTKKGKIIYENGFTYNEEQATDIQKASMAGIKAIAEMSSLEVHVYESIVENGKRYAIVNGKKRLAPNGYYQNGNQIYIDINAGNKGEGVMLHTLSHEVGHYIREHNPEDFKVIGDFLMENYGEKGVSVDGLIEKQKQKLIAGYKTDGKAIPSESKLLDAAYEELVCDAMSEMLADENAYVKLAELKKQNRNAWQKLGDAIKAILDKLKSVLGVYKDYAPEAKEADHVRGFDKATFERLQDLYIKAFVKADENYQSNVANIDIETQSVSPMLSERTWTESEYVTEREETAKKISTALGVDLKTAYKYIDDINGVARLIADDRARLDYEPNLDEHATVLKPNSEYKYTVDMSTLCAKRLLFTGTFDAIQKALPNMVFDSEDIVSLREMMQKRGYEVACGICYVESTRREIGRITQEFIDRYKEAQKTGKPITRINSSGNEVVLKSAGKTFSADPNYTPNLGELNTTDIDIVKRDHREVYDAYLAFMNARGQAKPKLLETRAEYKGEILKHFKAKSAVESRNNAGGLRLQSFSDFEVPHMIDMMQIVMDMSRVGLKSQAYTKVPAFAEVFGDTGVKINLSLIAKGDGLDANGNLVFDDVEGINHKEAFKLREKYSKNVGTILVGKTDAHIIKAMADPRIDYIIPFHKSSWKESLYDALGLTGYADYTDFQNEKPIDKNRKISNFDPSEYWDFSKTGDENAQIYLAKCREDGRIPKFSQFQGYPGYWKLLIDFKMYDNNGVGSPQEVVKPIFNTEASERILNDYKGGHKSFPVAKDVVEDFVKEHEGNEIRYSERYIAAEENPDILSLAERVESRNFKSNEKVFLGTVSDNIAKEIQRLTGVNVDGFEVAIEARQIEHILKDHGKNGKSDRSMANPSDIAKIEYTLKNYDDIRLAGKTRAYKHIVNGQTSWVDTVLYEKEIGEKSYYVVQAVPDTKAKTLFIVTAFIGKKGYKKEASQFIDVKNPDATPKSEIANTSDRIISHSDNSVNIQSKKTSYQERDSDNVSNRTLLANALESAVQNDVERNKLKEYKGKIALIEAEQQKLSEIRAKIKELSFAKGPRDTETIKKLQFEANQAANRINTYDRQLLNLEATKALKGVLEREKEMARKKAERRGKEALEKYRERVAKTQRELITRYQESRQKATENRNRTAMRHKIKDVVNELNQYLLKGTKDKHVPIELQKAVAEALDAVNMDTVGADERIAKLQAEMMKAKTPEAIQAIAKKIEHIAEMGGNMEAKLSRLKTAYDGIINSDDPLIANSHDDVISSSIDKVIEVVGNTPLRDMSLYQLEAVHDMYRMVLASIRNANKAFKQANGEKISTIANGVIAELDEQQKSPKVIKGLNKLSEFDWNNLKPVYAFERIGSANFTKVFNTVRAGEDVWATDVSEAKAFLEEQYKKHKYDSFDFDKKYDFVSSTGMKFTLTLDQIMSLYAYSKRGQQAKDHLKYGGFQFDGITETKEKKGKVVSVTYQLKDTAAYKISDELLGEIIGVLETVDGAKNFVDEMQDYLSATMGEKGNEVSLALYQVKLFKEKNYFPLRVSHDFLARAREQAQGEVKIKNSGFTKETKPNAKNPIVLSSFMDVWANHVNEMSMYHAFTLPLEDFYRVYNYSTPNDEKLDTVSVVSYLRGAHRDGAVKYIDQLLKDLNGGARVDSTTGIINKLTGLFKKSAVFASASVVIQQPSAIARATALVDSKYFVGKPTKGKHKEKWAEVKKYAPVAIIKEMGYFDTGMGQSTVEWLKGKNTLRDKIDDIASKAPALADEYSWCVIWDAVKRETLQTRPELKFNSEEFLKAVGERFTEVVTKTQVYDSVLARSAFMRSKDTGMKMATAFMGEPTTSLNMLESALIQGKRGNKRYARKAVGSVVASMILNSILVSIVYAGRDDDEDKTYAEKYVSTLTEELLDSLNPLTLIPFVKDIVSIVQGYDVERSDMAVISDLISAWNNLDSDNRSAYRKVEDFGGAIASIFGLPVKNIMRDVRGMYNTINSFVNGEKTTGEGIKTAVKEAITGKEKSNGQQLYDAMMSGDKAQVERVKGRFKDQNAINSAIRKALRDNDSRIKAAAEARYNGDTAEYIRIAKEIIGEGIFSQDDVVAAINSEISSLKKGEGTTDSSPSNKAESIYEVSDYYSAIVGRDQASANVVKEDLIKTDVANGKDRDEAEADFNSKFASYLREQYEVGGISEYEARNMLSTYGGKSAEEAASKVQYWEFKMEYPDYDLSEEAVTKYYSDVEPSGISVDVYYDYSKKRSKCKGTDLNGDGKTDSGSVKSEVLRVIDALPISSRQKDVLYYLNGWSASTIGEAPWH